MLPSILYVGEYHNHKNDYHGSTILFTYNRDLNKKSLVTRNSHPIALKKVLAQKFREFFHMRWKILLCKITHTRSDKTKHQKNQKNLKLLSAILDISHCWKSQMAITAQTTIQDRNLQQNWTILSVNLQLEHVVSNLVCWSVP